MNLFAVVGKATENLVVWSLFPCHDERWLVLPQDFVFTARMEGSATGCNERF